MLILNADRVEYCQVSHQADNRMEVQPGIAYRDRLFVKGKTYPITQKQEAIAQSRQEFAEMNGLVYILLVIDRDSLTLWYQNDNVSIHPEA